MFRTLMVCLLMLVVSMAAGEIWGPFVGACVAFGMVAVLFAFALVMIVKDADRRAGHE